MSKDPKNIAAVLLALQKQLADIQEKVEVAEGKPKKEQLGAMIAFPTPPPHPPLDLNERIRLALTEASLSPKELAKLFRESEDKMKTRMRELHTQGKVFNVGLETRPKWTWRVGDDAEGPLLRAVIKRLISETPLTLHDLVDATGARNAKVSGHMVEIQRTNEVVDLSGGVGHAKRYFLISPKVQNAQLAKKKKTGKG